MHSSHSSGKGSTGPIRPLRRDDLPEVVSLYELVSRSGSRTPAPGLAAYFERTCLDHPWFDPDIPSLVYEEDGRIVGFIASHVRRMTFDGRPIRLACGGQMVTEPEVRSHAVGAFLMQRFLSGPQDVTITDTAGEITRRMWAKLGGVTAHLGAMSWTRVYRPFRFAGERALRRRTGPALVRAVRPISSALDAAAVRVPGTSLRVPAPTAADEQLTPEAVVEHLPELARGVRLRPDYDVPFVRWLFDAMQETATYGRLEARLVRDADGRLLGWYVYYRLPGGLSQVGQVVARENDVAAVLDALIAHAHEGRSAALQGRAEPHMLVPLARRAVIFRWHGESLIHSKSPELLAALVSGDGMLTRLEGEWWMGHHLEPFGREPD